MKSCINELNMIQHSVSASYRRQNKNPIPCATLRNVSLGLVWRTTLFTLNDISVMWVFRKCDVSRNISKTALADLSNSDFLALDHFPHEDPLLPLQCTTPSKAACCAFHDVLYSCHLYSVGIWKYGRKNGQENCHNESTPPKRNGIRKQLFILVSSFR